MMTKTNILITGPPRCGKSTLIKKVVSRIESPLTGFFTLEMRNKGQRVGFSINTVDGREGILAHQNMKSRFRVGKYSVNLKDIEAIAVPSIMPTTKQQIVVIDEIGKMECFSEKFVSAIHRLFASDRSVLATVAQKGAGLVAQVKAHPEARLFRLTRQNRDETIAEILQLLSFLKGASR